MQTFNNPAEFHPGVPKPQTTDQHKTYSCEGM